MLRSLPVLNAANLMKYNCNYVNEMSKCNTVQSSPTLGCVTFSCRHFVSLPYPLPCGPPRAAKVQSGVAAYTKPYMEKG